MALPFDTQRDETLEALRERVRELDTVNQKLHQEQYSADSLQSFALKIAFDMPDNITTDEWQALKAEARKLVE